jgi:hypothetical protein
VDLDVTEKYITEIKNSTIYYDLLDTVRQYLEYCAYVEDNRGENSFVEGFF